MLLNHTKQARGFTIIEVLVAVAIIAILIVATVMRVNPGALRANSRNAQRKVDITTISNAVYQYAVDNNGQMPATITSAATEICKTGATSCAGLINLSILTTNQKYLVSVPVDPSMPASSNSTGYAILKNSYGRITVSAPRAESGKTITITN